MDWISGGLRPREVQINLNIETEIVSVSIKALRHKDFQCQSRSQHCDFLGFSLVITIKIKTKRI